MKHADSLHEMWTTLNEHNPIPHAPDKPISIAIRDLGYHYTNLIILRAALRSLVPPAGRAVDNFHNAAQVYLVRERVKQSLKSFVNHLESLRIEDMAEFWPPWVPLAISSFCFTLLAMILTSYSCDEALEWSTLLNSTRKTLRLQSKSSYIFSLGLLRIDSIFWRGAENVLHVPPHAVPAFTSANST